MEAIYYLKGKTPEKVRGILKWANSITDRKGAVMLVKVNDFCINMQNSDTEIIELIDHIDDESIREFRIRIKENTLVFDIAKIMICDREYIIGLYLDIKHFYTLEAKYELYR